MLIALFEFLVLLGSAFERLAGDTVGRYRGLTGHHDMLEAIVVDIGSDRPSERFAAHGCGDHLDRDVCRTLE